MPKTGGSQQIIMPQTGYRSPAWGRAARQAHRCVVQSTKSGAPIVSDAKSISLSVLPEIDAVLTLPVDGGLSAEPVQGSELVMYAGFSNRWPAHYECAGRRVVRVSACLCCLKCLIIPEISSKQQHTTEITDCPRERCQLRMVLLECGIHGWDLPKEKQAGTAYGYSDKINSRSSSAASFPPDARSAGFEMSVRR